MKPLVFAALSLLVCSPDPLRAADVGAPDDPANIRAREFFDKGGLPREGAAAPPSSQALSDMLAANQEEDVIRLAQSLKNSDDKKFWIARAWFQLGDKSDKMPDFGGAEKAYTNAFNVWGRDRGFPGERSPSVLAQAHSAQRLNALARAQLKLGRREAAAASYEQALSLLDSSQLTKEVRQSAGELELKLEAEQKREAQAGLAVAKGDAFPSK